MVFSCILCKSSNIVNFLQINNAPINIQTLLRQDKISSDKKITLNVMKCNSCNLIQLGNSEIIPENYYDDYLMSTSFSSQMNPKVLLLL